MKFVFISDTHGKHHQLQLPPGDVLIHAGDISMKGTEKEVLDFLDWFQQVDFRYKIFIAGNHDFFFEKETEERIQAIIPEGIIYLNDSSVEIEGIQIWGSPISPWFYDWAFNRHRGADIREHWDKIPLGTDIVITHGPVYGILDKTTRGEQVGCQDLCYKLKEIQGKIHVCGHIHEGYGTSQTTDTLFINCSVLNEKYQLQNKPIEWEFSV